MILRYLYNISSSEVFYLFQDEIDEIARQIRKDEEKRANIASIINRLKSKILITEIDEDNDEIISDNLINRITEFRHPEKIAAVDGGLLAKEYHGIDIILTRAVGVIFEYTGKQLEGCFYHPKTNPFPHVRIVTEALSEPEFRISASITRQGEELRTAAEVVEKFSPELLLMDGSICPHPAFKPSSDSCLVDDYKKLIEDYKRLFSLCKRYNTLLVGVVEDSRANKFCTTITEKIIPVLDKPTKRKIEQISDFIRNSRDTHLLFYLLSRGERTFTFKYSFKPSENPILRDLNPWSRNIYSFYLKTAELDRPVRIDFLALEKQISALSNRISSAMLSLSCFHSVYGIPTILIEADSRARLQQYDIDIIYASISDRVGRKPSLLQLRRNLRPF